MYDSRRTRGGDRRGGGYFCRQLTHLPCVPSNYANVSNVLGLFWKFLQNTLTSGKFKLRPNSSLVWWLILSIFKIGIWMYRVFQDTYVFNYGVLSFSFFCVDATLRKRRFSKLSQWIVQLWSLFIFFFAYGRSWETGEFPGLYMSLPWSVLLSVELCLTCKMFEDDEMLRSVT